MSSILFAGAAKNVTGSRHLVTLGGRRILLDCGNFAGERQVSDAFNGSFVFDAKKVDAVVLSHGHLDHCGSLPMLVKKGFRGKVWATTATRDVAEHILLDNVKVQHENYEHVKKNEPLVPHTPPLYGEKEVHTVMQRFAVAEYGKQFSPAPGVTAMLHDAGHIIGSSVVTLEADGERVGFTGDLGRAGTPTLRDPESVGAVQSLIIESTYGGHEHRGFDYARDRLKVIMKEAYQKKSKIIAPSFALGRTQLLLALVYDLLSKKEVPSMPIIVDSPLGDRLSMVYEKHIEFFDAETRELMKRGDNPFRFPELSSTVSREESKLLNDRRGPMFIISSSGMCEAGRVKHHLAHNIENSNSTILITGYMAAGTLGRHIVEGDEYVRIFGKTFRNRAKVEDLRGLSAHGDENDLIEYTKKIPGLKRIFLVHGESEQLESLRGKLAEHIRGAEVIVPDFGQEISWV